MKKREGCARLDGRVAIVTGAGNGLGRAHALALAARGASIVVNDLGVDVGGKKDSSEPAHRVVDLIRSNGGQAVASGHDVSDWKQSEDIIDFAIEEFGDLHVLVNNAGILRDRSLANLSEAEWDAVINVHLKGHAAATKHAFSYWRRAHKDGSAEDRSVVMTTSVAGLSGNFGQANYAAAKAGILGLAAVVGIEGSKLGIRCNVISPGARTRMALAVPGAEAAYSSFEKSRRGESFDQMAPENVSGVIVWLALADCAATRQIFHVSGDQLTLVAMPRPAKNFAAGKRAWTPELLESQIAESLLAPIEVQEWGGFPEDFF